MKPIHKLGVGILSALIAMAAMGAVYNQFSPGGALSGTWNSQSVNLASGAFITGTLPASNGGTGQTAATDDAALVGNGTSFAPSAIPDCTDTGGNHLNYATSTNAFSCGTSGGGSVTQTSGTGTLSYANACTTTPTQNFSYVLTGNIVTLTFTSQFSCTSDSTAMVSDALPASIRPARRTSFANLTAQNSGSVVLACFEIDTSGVLTWYQQTSAPSQCATSGTWTASGVKGPLTLIGTSPFIANGNTFSYTLN